MSGSIHLVKLCVGVDRVEDLAAWQESRAAGTQSPAVHVTRMWPRRAAELLAGGSLYWVIRGNILVRQRVLDLCEHRGEDGTMRCAIILDRQRVRTLPALRRPFQGWRYLHPDDAPPDLPEQRQGEVALPPEMAAALADLGVR